MLPHIRNRDKVCLFPYLYRGGSSYKMYVRLFAQGYKIQSVPVVIAGNNEYPCSGYLLSHLVEGAPYHFRRD